MKNLTVGSIQKHIIEMAVTVALQIVLSLMLMRREFRLRLAFQIRKGKIRR